jgi:hypothetical protein
MPKRLNAWLCLACWLAACAARADWADFSRYGEVAEVAVEAGEIRLNLRLAESAAPAGLAWSGPAPAEPPPWLAERLPRLSVGGGQALAGRLQFLGRVEAEAGDPARQAYYEADLRYPLAAPASVLAIAPPAAGVSVGLVALHRGVPVSDLAPLQKTLKLTLDGADPWRSRFDDPALVRRHAEPRSYVYVEPYEVRHELLLRLAELKPWLDLGLKDPRYVEEGEREGLKQAIGAFLLGRNPLAVDGAQAAPQLDRVQFLRFGRAGVLPVDAPGRLDADTVLVGVVLAYLTDGPARSVELRWDLSGAGAAPRQLSLIRGRETFDGYMSPKQPVFAWSQEESLEAAPAEEAAASALLGKRGAEAGESLAFRAALLAGLTLSLGLAAFASAWLGRRRTSAGLGLLLVLAAALHPRFAVWAGGAEPGAAKLDEAQAKGLLQSLLHNAYRAFQLRGEEKAYDRLSRSLDGDLLDAVYLQQRRAMLRQAEGLGGEGKVDRIEVLESHARPSVGSAGEWQVDARWMAHGTVSHWGHAHERHNLYQARLTLRPADGQWKIVGLEFLGGGRLDAGASG